MAITKKIHSKANIKQSTQADNFGVQDTIPIGGIIQYGGDSAPDKFLICNGSVVLRSSYPALFAVIGTKFNTGGETIAQFRLPQFARRVPVGAGGSGTGVLGNAVGNTGGSEVHTLVVSEIPSHTHTYGGAGTTSGFSNNHTHSVPSGAYSTGTPPGDTFVAGTQGFHGSQTTSPANANHTHTYSWGGTTDGGTGGNGSHNNIQPSVVVNFIIKALN